MKIIKRSGAENTFDKEKIENAVAKANITVEERIGSLRRDRRDSTEYRGQML